jgi:hypothetical protein
MKIKIKNQFILLPLAVILFISASYPQGIISTKFKDLDFGEVFLGYSSNVLNTDPGAGKYSFVQEVFKHSNMLVTLTLPTYLTNNINTIPVIFDAAHTAWSKNDSPTGRINFNPAAPLVIKNLKKGDDMFVWLGGMITAPSNTSGGIYKNSIIINIEFY